jgi:hypothetical protein
MPTFLFLKKVEIKDRVIGAMINDVTAKLVKHTSTQ